MYSMREHFIMNGSSDEWNSFFDGCGHKICSRSKILLYPKGSLC